MISGINNTQPSFHGMYVIKGKASRVEAAKDLILEKCDDAVNTMLTRLEDGQNNRYKGLNRVGVLDLHDVFTPEQQEVHTLIGTNEHASNIVNWRLTMEMPEPDDLEEKIQDLKIHRTPFGVIVEGDIYGIRKCIMQNKKELMEKMAPYLDAVKAANHGDMDLMADFLIDNMRKIKQKLREIRDLAVVPYDEPKFINVEDLFKAAKENRFNFITGEIKAKRLSD